MSEVFDENGIFENLRQSLEDPYIVDLFSDINERQADINHPEAEVMTESIRRKIVNELNHQWIYFDQKVKVSGNLILLGAEDSRTGLQKTNIEDIDAQSKGFEIYRPSSIDDTSDDDNLRFGMVFIVKNEQDRPINAIADINDVSVEYPFPSQDKLEQKLDGDLLEYRQDIDEIIFQDGPLQEILSDLSEFNYDYDVERGYDRDSVRALERYINQVLNFDKQLPYHVVLDGRIHLLKGDRVKTKAIDSDNKLYDIAGVDSVRLYKTGISEDKKTAYMSSFVHMRHYPVSQDEPAIEYAVDAKNIQTIFPMRDDVDTEYFK